MSFCTSVSYQSDMMDKFCNKCGIWGNSSWVNTVKKVVLKQELIRNQPHPLWTWVKWSKVSEKASHLPIFTKKKIYHFLENKNVTLDQIFLFPVSFQLSREYGQAELLL